MKEKLKTSVHLHIFHTSHLRIENSTTTLLLFQVMELLVMIAGRHAFWLRVKDTKNFAFGLPKHCWSFPSINVLIQFQKDKGSCSAIQPFPSKLFRKDVFCSHLTLFHPSHRHTLDFERGCSVFWLLLLSFLCSEMKEDTERSTSTTCIYSRPDPNNSPVHRKRDSHTSREAGG